MSEAKAVGVYALYLAHSCATLSSALRPRNFSASGPEMVGGILLSFAGLSFYVASVRRFGSFKQLSGLEAGELVTGGVYRYTRNPQIVGWGVALLGVALAGRSSKALTLVAAYFLAHRLYFPFEERSLERAFGEEYRRYRARVPRFPGLPG